MATMLVAAAAPAGAAATMCRDADLAPTASDLPAYADATLCLINEQRAAAELPALTRDGPLDVASEAYAGRMVAESFFGHVAPDGADLTDRLAAANYFPPGSDWIVGENLAWAAGPLAAPGDVSAGWMASPGHRANILDRDFREIGVGVVVGSPGATEGVTVTTDFGALESPQASQARISRAGPADRTCGHQLNWCGGRHHGRRPGRRAGGRAVP